MGVKPRPSIAYEVKGIPPDMMRERRWVNWKAVQRDGQWTKVPVQPDGTPAKSNDPATWHSFEDAISADSLGIGFMLGDGWLGVDFDRLPDEPELAAWVEQWISRHPGIHVETSPSGTGIKAICRATMPDGSANRKGAVELYEKTRFFTVTGRAIRPVEAFGDGNAAVGEVAAKWLQKAPTAPKIASGDASAADWSLCCDLAARGFRREEIAARLVEKMTREGRSEKAGRADYIERTVGKALEANPATEDGPLEGAEMSALIDQHRNQTPFLIHGLLRRGEVMGLVAPPKARKSFLVGDLALSCATGTEWHGHFAVEHGKVLLVDNELTANEIANRTRAIMRTRGIDPEDIRDHFSVVTLRDSDRNLDSVIRGIEAGPKYDLIVFDALYMFLEKGMDENSNADMTVLLRKFRRLGARTGACVVLVHHTSKGAQGSKDPIDAGAGAGAFGRALDTVVTLYRHAQDNYFVVHYRQRSSAPRGALAIHWSYPVFTDAMGGIDLEDLHKPGQKNDT
jgi:hypothetical protein